MNNCLEIFRQAEKKYTDELIHITGGAVKSVGEMTKRSAGDKWLQTRGVDMPSLAKDFIDDILSEPCLVQDPAAKRALEIRQLIGGASIKKLFAMERTLSSDGRIRELFIYCGAERTGRFAGRGAQPQNLKNSGPDCKACPCGHTGIKFEYCPACGNSVDLEDLEWGNTTTQAALDAIATRSLPVVESGWGEVVDVVASCLRGLFVAAPGHDLICSDYSAIEAVVIACLAGEQWRIDVFNTHGKIYEASASQASGIPLETILAHKTETGKHHPLRKKGKVRELAGGYGGWIGAWKNFGAEKYMSDDEIKRDILSWREESPNIVEFWGGQWRKQPGVWRFDQEFYGLEGAAVQSLLYPGQCFAYRDITYGHDLKDDVLYCRLPSGRKLAYHQPRLTVGTDPRGLQVYKINFMGWNSDSSKGPVGWMNIETYSGKLAENCTQAVARDILVAAMLRVEAAGYPIVLHVHDEIIAEVPKGFGNIEEFERLMMVREPWFADWPIKAAGGWRGDRYRK